MDAPDRSFPDLVSLLKSWIPWRSEPTNVSRDFWMPDQSCRVCYECDSQFTLFNRRHHCRHCGRVFCAKCTSNWIPAPATEPRPPREDWEKIRVCNYCFKQWEQGSTTAVDNNGIQVVSLDPSSSPSATSFISSKSSATGNSSSITFASVPQSGGVSPPQSLGMEAALGIQHAAESGRHKDPSIETALLDPSPKQFGCRVDRFCPSPHVLLFSFLCWNK